MPSTDINLFWPTETQPISVTQASGSVTFTGSSAEQLRIYNAGSNIAFIRWGTGAQTALATDMPIPPGDIEVFYKGSGDTVAAICSTGLTTTLYCTSGRGI